MTQPVVVRLAVEGGAQVIDAADRASAAVGRIGGAATGASSGADLLSAALGRIGHYARIAVIAKTITDLGAAAFQASARAERLATQLDFATAGRGAEQMAFVSRLATKLGLDLTSTAQAYAGFASAARGTSIEGEKTQQVFTAIAKASAVMGLSTDETRGALLAVQQMMSKGVVSAEEFRGQLGERMPIALQTGARALGVTTAEFSKLLETGQIVAADFLPKFAKAMEESVGAAAEKAAGRLDGAVARMGNAWQTLLQSVGDAGVAKGMAAGADGLAAAMTAITQSMERARDAGGGTTRQLAEGLSTIIARGTGLHLVSDLWRTYEERIAAAADRTQEARAKVDDLRAALDKQPGNIVLAQTLRDTERLVAALQQAEIAIKHLDQSAAESARLGGGAPPDASAAEDARLARMNRVAAMSVATAEAMDKFATKSERAQKEVDAWKKKLGDAFTPELERRIRDSLNPPNKGAESPYKAAAREIDQTVAALQRRLAAGRELTRAEELEIRLADQLADKSAKLRAGEREALAAKNAKAVAIQRDIDLAEQEARAAEAVARARADARNAESQGIDEFLAKQDAARQQELDSAKDRLRAFKAEEEAIVKSKALHVSLAEAVEMVALARLHEEQAKFREDSPQYEKLQREIDARRQLLSLMGRREARDASEKAAQEAAEAWKKVVDQAGQSLADSLMQGGRSAREYIVGLFRSLTLRPIIQAIVQPIVGAASSLLPGVANASSAAKAGDLLGSASSAANLFSLNLASSLGSVVSSAGRLFGVSALSSFGAGAQGASLAAGLAGPTTAGAAGATGLGASFAAAAPWLAGALAIFSAKDALFGRKLKDTSIEGTFGGEAGFSGSTEQFYKGGLFRSNKTVTDALGADIAQPLAAGAQALRAQVTAYAEALALPTDAVAQFTDSIRLSVKGLSPEQVTAKLQEALAGFGEGLAGTLSADVGPFAKAGEKTGDTLARLARSLGAVNPLLAQLGLDVLAVGVGGADAASKLADAFGGLDKLGSAAGSFYQNFYSEQERAAKASEALAATLADVGLSVPATREAFRDLVEAQDLTTEAGRSTFATLLEVSDAFAQLTPATGTLAETLRSAADIAQERASLEDRLLQLQGDTVGIRQRERDALDESNRALHDQIAALEDQAAAVDAAAEAAAAAAELAAQVKSSVDTIVGDFVSGPELQRYRANRIAEQLGTAGIQATPEGVLAATRDDVLALWRAVGDEAKLVVADLYDDWKALQTEIAQGEIDTFLAELGVSAQDLQGALADLAPSAESLVDTWRRTRSEVDTLAAALDEIEGTKAASALDNLRETIGKRDGLRGVIAGNADRIGQLRGSQGVDQLRQREADLWREFASTSNPAVAQAITDTTLERIALEASLQADASATQIAALEEQISAAERLRDVAGEMGGFVQSLRAGTLSTLSFGGRLDTQRGLFEASLTTGQDVQGQAQTYLQMAQQAYGGSTAQYAAIFAQVTGQLETLGLSGGAAGEQISEAQAQLDALRSLGDASGAQIAALEGLNLRFGVSLGALDASVQDQLAVQREQLATQREQLAALEAQIEQAGMAYQRMVDALTIIAEGASGTLATELAGAAP